MNNEKKNVKDIQNNDENEENDDKNEIQKSVIKEEINLKKI